jgi:hypothetical protein
MRKAFFILFLAAFALNASAQYIAPFFTTMPNDILPYLSVNNRKDLIDLFNAGKTAKVENLLKGETTLKALDENYIKLQLNASAVAEMKLLPLNDTAKIIAVIKTVSGKAADSQIQFFTSSWQKISIAELLPKITLNDFINKQALATNQDSTALQTLDIAFISFSFSKDSDELTVSLDTENYLSKEDYKRVAPLLYPTFKLKWANGKFTKP